MNVGDILIFYVSERKLLTSIGVVESIDREIVDSDVVLKKVGKRTVYSRKEIEDIVKTATTVILFRHHFTSRK